MQRIEILQLFENQQDRVIIDVRSPSEFEKGHIPNAINIPLFSDEERAIVGTTYKRASPEKAMLQGLDFVGQKMSMFVKRAKKLAPEKKLIVYCWRGGKRSGSLSWLWDMTGFDVMTINGGYKAYRTHVLETIDNQPLILNRIGGKTGTGKTKILHHLSELGEQVIDLEGLAHHKGSAFGSLGELPQPSVEHFENRLFDKIRTADSSKRIWIENESRSIGRCFLPDGFWSKFSDSKLYNIEIPTDARIQRLCDDYAKYDKNDLMAVFKNIERKIGGQNAQAAIAALEIDDYPTATKIALSWYDKTYQFGLDSTKAYETVALVFSHAEMKKIAEELKNLS